MTSAPPPALEALEEPLRKPFRVYTGAKFRFMPAEPREVPGGGPSGGGREPSKFDGYEFTQPLYSSFAPDGVFCEPKLPPRPRAVRPKSGPVRSSGQAGASKAETLASTSIATNDSSTHGVGGGLGHSVTLGSTSLKGTRPASGTSTAPLRSPVPAS